MAFIFDFKQLVVFFNCCILNGSYLSQGAYRNCDSPDVRSGPVKAKGASPRPRSWSNACATCWCPAKIWAIRRLRRRGMRFTAVEDVDFFFVPLEKHNNHHFGSWDDDFFHKPSRPVFLGCQYLRWDSSFGGSIFLMGVLRPKRPRRRQLAALVLADWFGILGNTFYHGYFGRLLGQDQHGMVICHVVLQWFHHISSKERRHVGKLIKKSPFGVGICPTFQTASWQKIADQLLPWQPGCKGWPTDASCSRRTRSSRRWWQNREWLKSCWRRCYCYWLMLWCGVSWETTRINSQDFVSMYQQVVTLKRLRRWTNQTGQMVWPDALQLNWSKFLSW